MGDSTAMTIEFLRARLLSERNVSKAAKERADQLAKRVMELEEQLRFMTIQRRKSEQAAMEAISILEAHGMNDLSESVDSSSDEDETPNEEKGHEGATKEGEVCTHAKEKIVIEDAQSCSNTEVPASQVRSLSWKSRSGSPISARKLKGNQFRQRQRRNNSRSSVESSPKYKLGKSCRKIKRREVGSTSEENDYVIIGDASPKLYVAAMGSDSSFAIVQKEEAVAICSRRDEEMERVLEQQAQLIVQYEAEEEAQREWEKNYNATKTSNLDYEQIYHAIEVNGESPNVSFACFEKTSSKDVEIKSDIGDLSGIKEPDYPSDHPVLTTSAGAHLRTTDGDHEASFVKPGDANVPNDLSRTGSERSTQPCVDGLMGQAGKHAAVSDIEACLVDVAFPAKLSTVSSSLIKRNEGLAYGNSDSGSSNNIDMLAHIHINSPSIRSHSTSSSRGEKSKWELSGPQDPSYMNPYRSANNNLGGVLEALQHAKVSLKHELSRLPLLGECTKSSPLVSNHFRTTLPDRSLKVPLGSTGGSTGLFRLPTDTFPQAQSSDNEFYGSGLKLTAGYPLSECAITFGDNRQSAIPSVEAAPKNSMGKFSSCSYLPGKDLPASNRFSLRYSYSKPDIAVFPNGPSVRLGTQNLDNYTQRMENPPVSGHPLPSYLTSAGTHLPIRSGSSVHNLYFDSFHRNIAEPPTSQLSFPFSSSTRNGTILHDGIPKPQTDARNELPPQGQYFYGGNEARSNMQML